MTTGSNDLNLLLKAKVVKIKVELDYKGSGLPAQVDGITEKLKNKPVKLKVKLDATINDLTTQIKAINTKLTTSKSIMPIKLAVQIDVKGSATQIKKQLQEVYQTVEKFNKQYGKQIQEMQQKTQQVGKNAQSATSKQMTNIGGMADPSAYMKSLKEAEAYMKNTFGKGIFSSQELKDANGQLIGFTTALTKANGVVQKIRYDWDTNASKFVPINQQTVTQTERNVSKALNSLRDLDREIATLGTQQNKYWKESQALQAKSLNGTLTQDAVNSLKTRIKEEQALQGAINKENALLRQQKELIAQINRAQKEATSSRVKTELGNLKSNASSVNIDSTEAKNQLNDLKSSFNSLKSSYDAQIKKEKELATASQKRLDVLDRIAKLQRTNDLSTSGGAGSARYVEETKALAKNIKTMEDYNAVMKRVSATTRALDNVKFSNTMETQLGKLKSVMSKYATETGRSQQTIEARFDQVSSYVGKNLQATNNEIARYTRLLDEYKKKLALQQRRDSIVQLSPDKSANKLEHQKVTGFVTAKDNDALKQYISNLNGAQVAMMRVVDAGGGITRITTQFASTGKTAKQVTYEVDQADKKLRQLSTAEVFNANRNLGIFEQLKIAIARVPVWMTAMTAFYGSIRSIKAVTNEILTLDKSLTELRRVADAGISIDHLFSGAIDLSKELGNNIHDVMQAVSDMARTFGDFNERQLLAITRTATLMSNVSDLTAQEATESLIGTMNAFNITAEDSVRIVDSMNEVDNNYAISTKQLATGLAKSASTAKTFGVTMEENIGHVTAIGAVTMESGNVIGNSLKTIYSRITTMAGAGDALESVGVAINDMATGEVREVGDILKDLSYKWFDLTDAQRQNIGVSVAGRYQLSRFLALMNNFDMATEATKTALTSQGSAVRENAEYMKSFEARINQLKNKFTELSSAIGDAFLSSGLSILISGLASLAEVGVKVVSTFGALPTVFAVLAPILLKFGLFGKATATLKSGLETLILTFMTTSSRATLMGTAVARSSAVAGAGLRGLGTTATATFTAIGTGAVALFTKIKAGFLTLLASTGVGLAFVGLGLIIEGVIKLFSEYKAEQEEIIKTNEKLVESYRSSGDGMQSMFDQYEQLMNKKKQNIELTREEQDSLDVLSRQFAEQLPTVVDHYTDSGEAVLKTTDKIKEQIKYAKELSLEQAKLTDIKFEGDVKESSKAYVEAFDNVAKAKKKLDKLMKEDGTTRQVAFEVNTIDNSEEIQKQIIRIKEAEMELSDATTDTVRIVQKKALAYFEANGSATKMTESQFRLTEALASVNDEYLRSAEDGDVFEERADKLAKSSQFLGGIFAEAFDKLSQGLEGKPEALSKLKADLDLVAKSIPDDFLKIDENDYVGSMERITKGTKEFINISSQVRTNSSADFDVLTDRLVNAGFTMEEAQVSVTKLAIQHENLGLKQQAQAQNAEMVTQATAEMNEELLQSINVIEEVFGYADGEFSALKQQIELMEILREKYGDSATETIAYKDAQNTLATAFGVTTEEVEKNIHDYNLAIQALQDLKVITDEQGGSYLNIAEITEGMTKKQIDYVLALIDAKNKTHETISTFNETSDSVGNFADAVANAKKKVNEDTFDLELKPLDAGFKSGVQDLITAQGDLKKLVKEGASVVNQKIDEVNGKGKDLIQTKEGLDEVGKSAEDVDRKATTSSKNISSSFSDMTSAVSRNTDTIIGKHKSQIDKVNELATAYRNANRDVSGINSTITNSMNTLSTFQSKLSNASSLINNAKNSFTMNSYSRDLLLPNYNGVSDSVAESISTFTANSDAFSNGGSFSGGDGTSGIVKTPTSSLAERFEALHNTIGYNGGYNAYKNGVGSAVSSTVKKATTATKKTSTAKSATEKAKEATEKAEQLAELYVIDLLNRKKSGYEATLNALQGKIKGLSENTKQYRDSLREIREYEKSILLINQQELANTVARNKQIDENLKKLANTSKHTKAQRDEYNKLQQEYDSNLSKIATLQGTIENAIVDIRKQSEAVFLDFVDEVIDSFDKSFDAISGRLDNLDFKMEVLELTNPDDIAGKIDILVDKTVELVRNRNQLEKERKQLEADAVTATAKYGANSDAVKKLTDRLKENAEAWEDVTLSILRTEKEIRDIRGDMADKIIDLMKNNYKEMEKASTTAIDNEIKALKKAHDEKIKMYDAEIKKINDIYSAKIKSLDDERDNEDYEKEKAEKTQTLSDLQKQEALYAKDDTLEGRKRYAEIKKEREKAQQELDKLIKDRQLELLKEQLNNEKDALVEGLESKKDAETESNDIKLESLEAEKEAISEHYASITEDEKKWAKIREELIKGNFGVVKSELESMGIKLEQITDGTFDTLSSNFASYSEQVRNFVIEMNNMIKEINAVTNTPSGGTQNGVGIGKEMTPYQASEVIRKAKNGIALDDPTPDKNNLYELAKNSSIGELTLQTIFEKASKGEAMIAPTTEKQMFYDLFLEILGKKAPRFNTGGFTGDWAGTGGKMAILDKKELVLNEGQTRDILDAVQLISKMSNMVPTANRSLPSVDAVKSISANTNNTYDISINIDKLNGDKKGADLVVKEIMKGMKKLGR